MVMGIKMQIPKYRMNQQLLLLVRVRTVAFDSICDTFGPIFDAINFVPKGIPPALTLLTVALIVALTVALMVCGRCLAWWVGGLCRWSL